MSKYIYKTDNAKWIKKFSFFFFFLLDVLISFVFTHWFP